MKRICLSINDELKVQLEKEAKEMGISLSAYIRLCLLGRKK